jgi:hypothetical protein
MNALPPRLSIGLCIATIVVGLALTLAGQPIGPWLEVGGLIAGLLLLYPRGGKRRRVRARSRR